MNGERIVVRGIDHHDRKIAITVKRTVLEVSRHIGNLIEQACQESGQELDELLLDMLIAWAKEQKAKETGAAALLADTSPAAPAAEPLPEEDRR